MSRIFESYSEQAVWERRKACLGVLEREALPGKEVSLSPRRRKTDVETIMKVMAEK